MKVSGESTESENVEADVGFCARMLYASPMRCVKVTTAVQGTTVAERAGVADTSSSRRRGLLGTDALPQGEGLLIVPCRQVHTFGMRYPIDAVFLDDEYRVLRVVRSLRPHRLGPLVWRARAVLELPAGTAEGVGIAEGVLLEIAPLHEE